VPAVTWFVLGGQQFWVSQLSLITGSIGDVNGSVSQGIGDRLSGDPAHEFVVLSRIALTLFVGLLCLIGWFVLRRRGHRTWTLPVLAAVSFGLAVLQPYGGEVFLRCYLFALPWFAMGAAVALRAIMGGRRPSAPRWQRSLRVLLVGLALFGIAGTTVFDRGGNDAYTGMTQADLDAMHWVYARAAAGDQAIALLWYTPLRADRVDDVVQLSTEELATAENPCATEPEMVACLQTDKPQYVLVNPQQEKAGVILDGLDPGWSQRVVGALTADGYRVVFDENGSLVLAAPGANTTAVPGQGGN
jgi:hypothetical protein